MILHNKIKKIINAIKDSDINEIEISSFWGAQKIRLTKNNTSKVSMSSTNDKSIKEEVIHIQDESVQKNNNDEIEKNINEDSSNLVTISAPLVGTFYASAKPGEPPFINQGDTINQGQSICIIEAMKIFNEIESDFDGTIVEILIDDQSPVEFNQPIFSIKEK